MKLKNKYTGKVVELEGMSFPCDSERVEMKFYYDGDGSRSVLQYDSFDELKDEWEKYEEPKGYWYIRDDGSGVGYSPIGNSTVAERREEIGNYFETKEEAEQAVDKLRAWQRLKDKGFEFRWIDKEAGTIKYAFYLKPKQEVNRFDYDDLDVLFGGDDE